MPDTASLAALRAWYAGTPSRQAVERYCPDALGRGQSARGVLGQIRRQLAEVALRRHRPDLAALFQEGVTTHPNQAKAIARAVEALRTLPAPEPRISDDIDLWLPGRAVAALRTHGIATLADLTVRIPRRRRWWATIPGLGARSAHHIESFFAAHPQLTERARALIKAAPAEPIVPWERIRLPHEVDGTRGSFRAPRRMCTLAANNDHEAINAWLGLHESAETQRAYRKGVYGFVLGCVM